jgi:hypothetical protein
MIQMVFRPFHTLREALADWEDLDIAAYYLAICLGILTPDDGHFEQFRKSKWVYWSGNPPNRNWSS